VEYHEQMSNNYIPNSTVWINPKCKETEIVSRILTANICVSDLDDTDALSPAKRIGFDFKHFGKYPSYWSWILTSGLNYLFNGKNAESQSWRNFLEKYLRNPQELERIAQIFNPAAINESLFPGVIQFYQSLSLSCSKVYVTRNIGEIASAYALELGIDQLYSETYDKRKVLENLVNSNPQCRRWIVKGDSDEDTEMLDYLRFKKKNRKIDDVVGIKVAKSKPDPDYDLTLFRDYRGLVELIHKYQ
jgi:hypothetical protein